MDNAIPGIHIHFTVFGINLRTCLLGSRMICPCIFDKNRRSIVGALFKIHTL